MSHPETGADGAPRTLEADVGSGTSAFAANFTVQGAEAVISLSGELDVAEISGLQELVGVVVRLGCHRATFELAGLDFIDGAGISTLIDVRRELAAAGVTLQLSGVSREVAAVAQLLGLSDDLAVATGHDSPETLDGGAHPTNTGPA